jgi:aryl-alcohol dehydrogenase-like predicted oxidoreductase
MIRAVEASLRRLGTDYLDLYLLHTWDRITPVEEVVQTFDDLVRVGKIRYAGLSDVPAWYAARAQSIASVPFVTVQLPYSLVNRDIELEYVPMAQSLGMGLTAWSPLSGGLLTGKYSRSGSSSSGRLDGSPIAERDWQIISALRSVASSLDRPMAQVAINWAATQPAVSSVIVGASSPAQLLANLTALDFTIPSSLLRQLDEASAPPRPRPYSMFTPAYQSWIVSPGLVIGAEPPTFAPPVVNSAS